MPLTRYQIRNEYCLADPELYRAAEKDDPEALLEGVAMAGLVGVLRQLGDLAEFAAEIFHDLHEEVMATAARGHGLMARVQQLEAEVPSIEKAILSQTNHSSFFSSAGVDWHPNLRMEQNPITREDLPRFVMDSYEECRGPPRLFLLDKFDVAGAGACLKRYTDPSCFKVEAASSGTATVEVQREKKIRKAKKKGSRWRNGETPEVIPTSHAKLHQLFLEERVDNSHSDSCLVKLKRRQLNGSPFDLKSGKSYMEKLLETASPERKVVCEVSVSPPRLKLTSDNSSESGIEILDICIVSPVNKLSERKESMRSSPNSQEEVLKPYMDELNGEAIERGIMKDPEPNADGESYESSTTIQKMVTEAEVAVALDGRTEGSLDGDHSDDMTSEVDNYMDALTTMESELETDNEYKATNDQGFLNVGKYGTDSDMNEEQLHVQANFPDYQSIGNFSLSDDGNNSIKKGKSSLSCSDSVSNFAENTASDGEGAAKVLSSDDNGVAEIVDLPSDHPSAYVEIFGTESHELMVLNDTNIEEDKFPGYMEASSSSCLTYSNPMPLPLVTVENSVEVSLAGPELDKPSDCTEHSKSLDTGNDGTYLADSSVAILDAFSKAAQNSLFTIPSESCSMGETDLKDPNVLFDALVDESNVPELAPKKKSSDDSMSKVVLTDNVDQICAENLVEGKVGSPHSTISPTEQQFPSSILPEVGVNSGFTLPFHGSDFVKSDGLISAVDDTIAAAGVDSENLTPMVHSEPDNIKKHQCSHRTVDISQIELDLAEVRVQYSEDDLKEIPGAAGDEEIGRFTGKKELMGGDAVPLEHPCNYSSQQGPQDHVDSDDVVVTETADDVSASAAADSAADVVDDLIVCSSSDKVSSPPTALRDVQESLSSLEDSHQKGFDHSDVTPPECSAESETEKQKQQLEVTSTDMDSRLYESVSDDYSSLEAIKHVQGPPVAEQTQSSPRVIEVTTAPTSETQNQMWEPKSMSHSLEPGEGSMCSSTRYLPETGTSSEQPVELQADQITAVPCHVVTDVDSKLLEIQTSPTCYLAEPVVTLEQSLELQSDQLDKGWLRANETSSISSNLQSEQIQDPNPMHHERWLNDLPVQEVLPQSAGKEFNGIMLASNPFHSDFPGFGLLHEATHVNPEVMPPLPPLPPMQWRMGKIQPAPLAQREWIDHSTDTFLALQPLAANEKSRFDFRSSDREIVQPPNPILSFTVADSERSQCLPTESLENSLKPTPTTVNADSGQQDCFPSKETQSLNPFLTPPEILDWRPEHCIEQESMPTSSNLHSPLTITEPSTYNLDPLPSEGPSIQPLDQLTPETGFEVKASERSSQNSEVGQGNSPVNTVFPVTMVEEQHRDLVSLQDETKHSLNSLALPPVHEVGMANNKKLLRPRSPLIEAVAAHDKSKLRKVTERVRPQPNVDERDSLLEQIRAKSFNLKPAGVTRPSIQSIQGPKTNLKVAAMLEKANSIRQALAGSDEDDDTDSWSDS